MLMLNIFDDAGTIMLGWLRIAMMSIIANVYNLIATFYNIFMYIVKVNILSGDNESLVSDIYNRIQVILAVVMVFYVTLEFVKYIVNPDTFSDKEKGGGGLLKRILIVIVLMAFTPQIFGIAYDFQGRIISSEVIPKVLIKNYNPTDFDDNAGGAFSSNLLAMFYKPYVTTEGNIPSGKCGDNRSAQQVVNDNLRILETKGKMVNATYCIAEAGGDVIADGEKHVNPYLIEMGIGGLLPLVIGCFMIWVLVNYCAEAGRVIIQFVFLQIIAPIPILSYVAPGKDGMFNKWVKQCTTTYLDLFIRLFIMYLILMLSQILIKVDINTLFGTFDFPSGSWMPRWIRLFLFVGLLMFAMKAPKMIKELLPGGSNAASGDFGIGWKSAKDRFATATRLNAAALGATTNAAYSIGARTVSAGRHIGKRWKKDVTGKSGFSKFKSGARVVGGAAVGIVGGGISGFARGAYNGGKKGNVGKNIMSGFRNQSSANKRFESNYEKDYSVGQRVRDKVSPYFGKTRVEVIEEEKSAIERRISINNKMNEVREKINTEAEKKVLKGEGQYGHLYQNIHTVFEGLGNGNYPVNYTYSDYSKAGYLDSSGSFVHYNSSDEAYEKIVMDKIGGTLGAMPGNGDFKPLVGETREAYNKRIKKLSPDKIAKFIEQKMQIARDINTPQDIADSIIRECDDLCHDIAIFDYIDDARRTPGVNGTIDNLFATLQAEIRNYNENPKNDKYIIGSAEQTMLESPPSSQAFDDYVKKNLSKHTNDLETGPEGILELNRKLDVIKAQVSGNESSGGSKK